MKLADNNEFGCIYQQTAKPSHYRKSARGRNPRKEVRALNSLNSGPMECWRFMLWPSNSSNRASPSMGPNKQGKGQSYTKMTINEGKRYCNWRVKEKDTLDDVWNKKILYKACGRKRYCIKRVEERDTE